MSLLVICLHPSSPCYVHWKFFLNLTDAKNERKLKGFRPTHLSLGKSLRESAYLTSCRQVQEYYTVGSIFSKSKTELIDFFFLLVQSDQLLSLVPLFVTPWTAALQASLSTTNSWSLLKIMSIKLVMPSNHLILYHPLFLPPSIFPSIREESVLCIRYWSFSFSISPSNEYSRLIYFH